MRLCRLLPLVAVLLVAAVGRRATTKLSMSNGSTTTWAGDLDLRPGDWLTGDTNDLFRVGGSFNNQSTNTTYNILTATFEFTDAGPHNLEQASINRGPLASAISNNWAFGTLKTAGTVTVTDNYPNSPGNDAIYVQQILGTGTLNVGADMRVYFGSTNGWAGTVNITSNGVFRPYLPDALDSDGDGMVNSNEWKCGTEMTDSKSVLRIMRVAKEGNNIRVTWTTVGGHSYILQTNSIPGTGFADFNPLITVPGSTEGTTNYLHIGGVTVSNAFFYRVRLGP